MLQERRFRPVGGKEEINSNFRLIAATNRDLDRMVREGNFRQDLLYRLRSIIIDLPPLKERKDDLRELAMHFMTKYCDHQRIGTKGFSPEFLESLAAYDWPGNVRELSNVMTSTLSTAADDPVLFPKHLPVHMRVALTRDSLRKEESDFRKPKQKEKAPHVIKIFKEFREKALAEAEKTYLYQLMSATRWNIKEACHLSGLSQPRLYALLKKHEMSRPR